MATNEQSVLRRCQCGWSKVTTYRGLRTHQGKAKCGGYGEAQPFSFLTSPTQSWTAPQSLLTPSIEHKQLEEPASLQNLQQNYGILGISLQSELQRGPQSSDWTRSQRPVGMESSVTAAQPLRSVLELRGQIYTEERALSKGPVAALKAPPAQTHSDELETLKTENERLKTRCEEFNAANVKLTAAMKALERQNGELETRCNELKASRKSINTELEILKQENENLKFRVQTYLAKTKEKNQVKSSKQTLPPCGICGHYITQMYKDFLSNRPEQAYKPPCQQCDDGFVQLYQDYLNAKQLKTDYKTPCEQCREEYTSLCGENLAVRFADLESCQDCGHNFKQLAEILQIPTENASERTRANTSSEDTSDPCSETELKKEFDQLKKEFPKALKSIKSQKNSEEGKALKVKLQWTLDIAKRDTMKKQEDLQHIFPAEAKNKTPALLQLTLSNLQTALHNCSESYYQSMIQEFIKDEPKEVSALLVKWYRLSCLMVLHNPPLLPRWDRDGFPCSIDVSIKKHA